MQRRNIAPISHNDEGKSDGDHEQRKELPARQSQCEGDAGIGLTELFPKNAHERVNKKERSGHNRLRHTGPGAQKPEHRKQEQPFQRRFVERSEG